MMPLDIGLLLGQLTCISDESPGMNKYEASEGYRLKRNEQQQNRVDVQRAQRHEKQTSCKS